MDLSAATFHAALTAIEVDGWDCPEGWALLELVRRRMVEPTVRRCGLRGPAADQAVATAWAAAWDALRRPSARAADNPAGMAWVAVRRAVSSELGMRGRELSLPTSELLEVLGDGPWPPIEAEPSSCPELTPVFAALRSAGWDAALLADLVDCLGLEAVSGGRVGWRAAARRAGCPEWRASRLATLLLGAPPDLPGLVELRRQHGAGLLDDPDVQAAIRSTSRGWMPAPTSFLRAAEDNWGGHTEGAESPCAQAIWRLTGSVPTVRAPIHGGLEQPRIEFFSTTGEGGRMPEQHAQVHTPSDGAYARWRVGLARS